MPPSADAGPALIPRISAWTSTRMAGRERTRLPSRSPQAAGDRHVSSKCHTDHHDGRVEAGGHLPGGSSGQPIAPAGERPLASIFLVVNVRPGLESSQCRAVFVHRPRCAGAFRGFSQPQNASLSCVMGIGSEMPGTGASASRTRRNCTPSESSARVRAMPSPLPEISSSTFEPITSICVFELARQITGPTRKRRDACGRGAWLSLSSTPAICLGFRRRNGESDRVRKPSTPPSSARRTRHSREAVT